MLSGDDFAAVLKSRQRMRSAHFSLHWRASLAHASRLGLVVSKKFARTSVRRNLIKRQTRILFGQWIQGLQGLQGLRESPAALDVVLKLNANVTALERAAQYSEIAGLMRALPRN
jgi:ribonuclease P protein component